MCFQLQIFTARLTAFALLALTLAACQRGEMVERKVVEPFAGVDTALVDSVLAGMSSDEKLGQLLLWIPEITNERSKTLMLRQVASGKVGGLLLEKLPLDSFFSLSDSCRRLAPLPLFFATRQKVSLHNQFEGLKRFPSPSSMAAIDSVELHRQLEDHYWKQCKALGINFCLNPGFKTDDPRRITYDYQLFENDPLSIMWRSGRVMQLLRSHRILPVGDYLSDLHLEKSDSLRDSLLLPFRSVASLGLGGLLVGNEVFSMDTLKNAPARFLKNYLHKHLDFSGVIVSQPFKIAHIEQRLKQGADLLLVNDAPAAFRELKRLVEKGKLTEAELDKKVRKVLQAKAWTQGKELQAHRPTLPKDSAATDAQLVSFQEEATVPLRSHTPRSGDFWKKLEDAKCYFEDPGWDYFIRALFERTAILARNHDRTLPLMNLYDGDFRLVEYSNSPLTGLRFFWLKYADFKSLSLPKEASGDLRPLRLENTNASTLAVVVLDSINLLPGLHRPFINSLNELSRRTPTVLINFGNPKNLQFFDSTLTIVQAFERNRFTEAYIAQILFGGAASLGVLPTNAGTNLPFGASVFTPVTRLSYVIPEKAGIARERLTGINAIAESAIDNGVFPGCQVAVAKDGQVIYSRSFGKYTYKGDEEHEVRNHDLYDIASLTKVAATTLAVMKLYEQEKIDLTATTNHYLALDDLSTVKKISIEELLAHHSGMPPQMPIGRYISRKNTPEAGCNSFYCRKERDSFNVRVADNLFLRADLRDSIWDRVLHVTPFPSKRFRYSDVNFFLLQRITESIAQTNLDHYVFDNIYRPLGLRHTCFQPLQHFTESEIVPTERDYIWRKSLVQGFVHDPSAALMGGVGGNAGVFANAEDLLALFQMLLNGGKYGGILYFEEETVKKFTSKTRFNHRGLGFDRPTSRRWPTYSRHASAETYGHTGFTGTCAWVDPKENLVYIFLSNRVYPNSSNGKIFTEGVRSRIHTVVYDAIGSFQAALPELEVTEEVIDED